MYIIPIWNPIPSSIYLKLSWPQPDFRRSDGFHWRDQTFRYGWIGKEKKRLKISFMSTLSSPLNVDRAILVLCRILRLVVGLQHQSSATWSLKLFLGMAFRLTRPLDRRTTQKWDVWERSLVSWFLQHRGDTFCGLTFKIGGRRRLKGIHSLQHSIFVKSLMMTMQVILFWLSTCYMYVIFKNKI